eukprot:11873744-Alexandrium_andersonii.AAC.1
MIPPGGRVGWGLAGVPAVAPIAIWSDRQTDRSINGRISISNDRQIDREINNATNRSIGR